LSGIREDQTYKNELILLSAINESEDTIMDESEVVSCSKCKMSEICKILDTFIMLNNLNVEIILKKCPFFSKFDEETI
jgi:hypothetical protein